ncbi:hypothetical protein UNSWDHB_1747 [Dehalobacter sp. UNSWDHB]|nr:hypothetical protein DCF50_p2498 [Dehalobacter sp. CF]EQB20908.1 hypothetical protein UNSWDHB_1747 [Dehalobacter sp. UNSWDHB]
MKAVIRYLLVTITAASKQTICTLDKGVFSLLDMYSINERQGSNR